MLPRDFPPRVPPPRPPHSAPLHLPLQPIMAKDWSLIYVLGTYMMIYVSQVIWFLFHTDTFKKCLYCSTYICHQQRHHLNFPNHHHHHHHHHDPLGVDGTAPGLLAAELRHLALMAHLGWLHLLNSQLLKVSKKFTLYSTSSSSDHLLILKSLSLQPRAFLVSF